MTPDARCDTKIEKRIALSKDTFTKMGSASLPTEISAM